MLVDAHDAAERAASRLAAGGAALVRADGRLAAIVAGDAAVLGTLVAAAGLAGGELRDELAPGVCFVVNDPSTASAALELVAAVRGVEGGGAVVCVDRWPEIGRRVEPGEATDRWQQGHVLTPMRVLPETPGSLDALAILAANVADGEAVRGALGRLVIAAGDLAWELAGIEGDVPGGALAAELHRREGWQGTAGTRVPGHPSLTVRLAVRMAGGRIAVDFTGSDDAPPDERGSSRPAVLGHVLWQVARLARGPSSLAEAAAVVDVVTPPGSAVDAPAWAPVGDVAAAAAGAALGELLRQ